MARLSVVILSAISTLAIGVLWVHSMSVADAVQWRRPGTLSGQYSPVDWGALSGYGFVNFTRTRRVPTDPASAVWLAGLDQQPGSYRIQFGPVEGLDSAWEDFFGGMKRFGISAGTEAHGGRSRIVEHWRSVEVPDWAFLLLAAAPGVLVFASHIRARHRLIRRPGPTVAA